MNPGFMSIWIMSITFVLIATGWKSYLAPEISARRMALLVIVMVMLLGMPLWWSPFPEYLHLEIQISVCLLLFIGSVLSYKSSEQASYLGYLILCTLMISIIWGFIRKMYSYDPVFYWLGPSWDAPLLAGIFCGAFTSQVKHQFGMMVWGAVLGETVNTVLQSGLYTAQIGHSRWWDSFWIAIAAARLFSLLLKAIRLGISKLSIKLWHIKGGRSS